MVRGIKAVIFDFDGLMVDTESPAFVAWSEIYREHGCELSLEEWVACVGSTYAAFDPVERLTELSGKKFDRDAVIADKERRKFDECQRLPAMAGVEARLEEAAELGLAVAVASSSSRAWVQGHLRRLGLDPCIKLYRTREDVERVKPHPDLYLSAAEGLKIDPRHCLVFEDSLNGVKAAKAAGMACFAIPGPITRSLDFAGADKRYESLLDVSLRALAR